MQLISPLSPVVTNLRSGSCPPINRMHVISRHLDRQEQCLSACPYFFPIFPSHIFFIEDVNSSNFFTDPKARKNHHFNFSGPGSYLISVRQEQGICLFSLASIPALDFTQPSLQYIPGIASAECEAEYTPFSAELKKCVQL